MNKRSFLQACLAVFAIPFFGFKQKAKTNNYLQFDEASEIPDEKLPLDWVSLNLCFYDVEKEIMIANGQTTSYKKIANLEKGDIIYHDLLNCKLKLYNVRRRTEDGLDKWSKNPWSGDCVTCNGVIYKSNLKQI